MKAAVKGLRPYAGVAPLIRLAVGAARLGTRLLLFCMAGEGANKAWRALGLLVAAGTAYRAAAMHPIVMVPVTLLVAVLAWRAGVPKAVVAKGAEQQATEEERPAEVPLTLDELTAALHAVGAPHAHLSALATHLTTTPARVREGLTGARIPIAGGVRMKGCGVSTGVRVKDFPPLSSPTETPPEAVVVAGQAATTTAAGPTVVHSAGGAQITVTPAREHASPGG